MTVGFERVSALGCEAVIQALSSAGLRERGGSGLPVAPRWRAVYDHGADGAEEADKLVVCNAVDGDPLAPVARFVLAAKTGAVLDGLLIAASAVGATSAVICVSADYAEEIAALGDAVERLRQDGRPEQGTGGPSPCCDVRIVEIPAGLVAGEETALIRALEGRQPVPYLRTPGDVGGVHGAPTLIESAETLAAVSAFFGGTAGASVAPDGQAIDPSTAPDSGAVSATAGGKVVTVFGDVTRPLTVEVPAGTTIAGVIEEAEGRSLGELDVKAVQFGGPTGRFLTGDALLTPLAHDDLERVGAVMGNGSIRVFGGSRCAVEMARNATAYLHEESCGKCGFCREGTRQVVDILDDLTEGRATAEQMDLLLELGRAMKAGSICGIGWGAADPVLSALELFGDDFRSHLEDKRCPERPA